MPFEEYFYPLFSRSTDIFLNAVSTMRERLPDQVSKSTSQRDDAAAKTTSSGQQNILSSRVGVYAQPTDESKVRRLIDTRWRTGILLSASGVT
jgi:hypothetical protein